MTYVHTLAVTSYRFGDLRASLARATPFRSGDALADVAATSTAERVADVRSLQTWQSR
jgi:ethanolamine ammonia-lyase large subunit